MTEPSGARTDPTYECNIPERPKIVVTRMGDTGPFMSFAWASNSGRLCVPVAFYGCRACPSEFDDDLCDEIHPAFREHWVVHVATGYAVRQFEEFDHAFELMDALDALPCWDLSDKDAVTSAPGAKEAIVEIMANVRKARADRGAP